MLSHQTAFCPLIGILFFRLSHILSLWSSNDDNLWIIIHYNGQSLITRPWSALPTIARLLAVIDSVCQQSHHSQPKSVPNPSICTLFFRERFFTAQPHKQTLSLIVCNSYLLARCQFVFTLETIQKMTKSHRSSYEMSTYGQRSVAPPAEEFAIDVHKVNLSYGWRGETVLNGLSLQLPRGNVRAFN